MEIKVLHLNIERDGHLAAAGDLLREEQPDVACFCEIYKRDAEQWASRFGYECVFSPLVQVIPEDFLGSAILSKRKIRETSILRYDDGTSAAPPVITLERLRAGAVNGNRPSDRFSYHAAVLTATLEAEGRFTVATTHFPVTDHATPGLADHTYDEESDAGEMSETRNLFDRFLMIMRRLPAPLVFTADLNNPRGEYMYDALAHELVDFVPADIATTLDPVLHRRHGLEFVVDTIMATPDIRCAGIELREGVSDHKALIARLSAA